MSVRVRAYETCDAAAWDAFVASSWNGNLLHSRRFLGYHGERFADRSIVVEADDTMVAVLPAALDPTDQTIVLSHPGSTYGGFVRAQQLSGGAVIDAFEQTCRHYRDSGLRAFRYKVVPHVFQRRPAQDDLYALARIDARRYRCDLSAVVDLVAHETSSRRKKQLAVARRNGLELARGAELLPAFWDVLATNLSEAHKATPTHSLEEMSLLAALFPNHIHCIVGRPHGSNEVLAGVVLFAFETAWHTQYIGSSAVGREAEATAFVLTSLIEEARAAGMRYFSFGTNSERGGTWLNDGLFAFKAKLGGSGVAHDFYEIRL